MLFYARSSPCYCVFLHSFRSALVRNCHAKEFFLDHHCQSSLVSRLIEWVIAVIHKSSFCLPVTSLRTLYYNLVYPYLTYCASVSASTYPTNLNRIVLHHAEKKKIRIISKTPFDAHTDPKFKRLQILKLSQIYFFQVGKFMYSY